MTWKSSAFANRSVGASEAAEMILRVDDIQVINAAPHRRDARGHQVKF
jgi:hypothetical protein